MTGRAPRGYTYEPCHLCGSTAMHKKGRLCNDCLDRIEKGNAAVEAAKGRLTTPKTFLAKAAPYALPYLPHEVPAAEFGETAPLRVAFWELGRLLSAPVDEAAIYGDDPELWPETTVQSSRRRGDWAEMRSLDASVGEKLGQLFTLTAANLDHAYKEGHKDGRNLLMQLAAGEITMDKLNETALRKEGA